MTSSLVSSPGVFVNDIMTKPWGLPGGDGRGPALLAPCTDAGGQHGHQVPGQTAQEPQVTCLSSTELH